jgi:hypothetical protein
MPSQADLYFKPGYSVTKNGTDLEFKFSVMNNGKGDDTARMVRVIVLLPVSVRVKDVKVVEMKKGKDGYASTNGGCEKCEAYWNSSLVVSRAGGPVGADPNNTFYDSTVSIDLGYLDRNEQADIIILTSLPKATDAIVDKIFGAFVYGSVPDPDPTNNYITARL